MAGYEDSEDLNYNSEEKELEEYNNPFGFNPLTQLETRTVGLQESDAISFCSRKSRYNLRPIKRPLYHEQPLKEMSGKSESSKAKPIRRSRQARASEREVSRYATRSVTRLKPN
jgi:hypothetical protein